MFQRYVALIGLPSLTFIRTNGSVKDPRVLLGEKYFKLYNVSYIKFKSINTSLRLSDGTLLAVKSLVSRAGLVHRSTTMAENVRVIDRHLEIELLSKFEHVSGQHPDAKIPTNPREAKPCSPYRFHYV